MSNIAVTSDFESNSTSATPEWRAIAKFFGHIVKSTHPTDQGSTPSRSSHLIDDRISHLAVYSKDSWISGISFERSAKSWNQLCRELYKTTSAVVISSASVLAKKPTPLNDIGDLGDYANELRDEAARLGIDFDKLIRDASSRFESPDAPQPQGQVSNRIIWDAALDELNSND